MFITKGSTNVSVVIRIVDSTDGTPETGVVFNTAGIDIWYRRDGAVSVALTEVTLAALTTAHTDGGFLAISDGWYRVDIPDAAWATGVNGVQIGGAVTGMVVHAPYIQLTDIDLFDVVRGGMTALPNAVADAAGGLPISDAGGLDLDSRIQTDIAAILVDTSTTLDTHLTDIKGATFSGATDSLEAVRNRGDSAWTGAPPTVRAGTAQTGSANTITLDTGASATDDLYNLLRVSITSGTGVGQSRAIKTYVGTTKVATVINNWVIIPDATSGFEIVSDAITEIAAAPTAAAVADAIWDESTAGHTSAGTFGEQCKNDIDAILADTAEMQVDWVDGGRLDLLIDAILVDTGELQTDWTNGGRLDLLLDAVLADTGELQSDWVNGGRLDLIIDAILADTVVIGATGAGLTSLGSATNLAAVDTLVTAIKVITDQMVFTKASELDVNTQSINGATVTGDGNATPWDGA